MNPFEALNRSTAKPEQPIRPPAEPSASWDGYVWTKVKAARATVFTGENTLVLGPSSLPFATGHIEINGQRERGLRTSLHIGFSRAADLPLPSFVLTELDALGTMCLPADCYMAVMQLVHGPKPYFQIGGDGKLNALASDLTTLQQDMKRGVLRSY
ncbi:hypothetical protein [Acidovorax sp. FG27]|uniref:hypothetical protein n=1 Tax=Acidovorax sp. FG27 TaxID=3133652 RepID=UPI00333ED151